MTAVIELLADVDVHIKLIWVHVLFTTRVRACRDRAAARAGGPLRSVTVPRGPGGSRRRPTRDIAPKQAGHNMLHMWPRIPAGQVVSTQARGTRI